MLLCLCQIRPHTPVAPVAAASSTTVVTVRASAKPLNNFVPARAFGAGIDGAEAGSVARVFRPGNIAAMRSMGLRSLTYRLRTELGIEAWHWNPNGTWSDPDQKQGYWTGDARAESGPISLNWGYKLPRRGNTIDQANNVGYSRIDDGDPNTYWKSNPYLDRFFTHEPNNRHPQWIVVDLGRYQPVNAIRVQWGAPYATHYRVSYAIMPPGVPARNSESGFEPGIDWRLFANGEFVHATGGDVRRTFATRAVSARFVRIWMDASSGENSVNVPGDARDHIGYSMREIFIGRTAVDGRFTDWVKHGRKRVDQSVIYASSTDPWHTAEDRDKDVEQPGFDLVASSGLTNDQPMLAPASLLFDTPENAVSELRYLRARHIDVRQMELGEEPDGQYVSPEDYGALYIQWSEALHRIDPTLKLGGPSFQTAIEGWVHWKDKDGDTSWLRRFLKYLSAHGRRSDFAFFSFEWYPFDGLFTPPGRQVPRNAVLLRRALAVLRKDGLPQDIPWIITEYGYSPFSTRDEVTMPGALVDAETVAEFLSIGGSQANLYGYPPGRPAQDREAVNASWGDLIALLADADGNVRAKLTTYWTAWLLTHAWTREPTGTHQLFPAFVATAQGGPDPLVAAFPVRRPDGRWSILLLNKDATRARSVRVQFDESRVASAKAPTITVWQYGSDQYNWRDDEDEGYPTRSLPPSKTVKKLDADGTASCDLPAFSIAVVEI